MRIAMLSPIAWRTPPVHYGPWEKVASLLTEALVGRGHDVTLFATKDSLTHAHLHAVCARGYEEDPDIIPKVFECLHISELFDHAEEFDIIHNHFDFLPLTYTGLTHTPVVTTIHGFSSPKILPVFRKYNKKTFYVSISDADRDPDLDYIRIFSPILKITCCFWAGFTRIRAPKRLSRLPGPRAENSSWPESSRMRPILINISNL